MSGTWTTEPRMLRGSSLGKHATKRRIIIQPTSLGREGNMRSEFLDTFQRLCTNQPSATRPLRSEPVAP